MADVKIDIPGVGEVVAEGAASEQTLKIGRASCRERV